MADLVLHDGREIDIDLYKVTRREFSAFFKPTVTEDEEDAFLAKVSGLTQEQVASLLQPDFDQLTRAVVAKRRELLANPT